MDTRQKRPQSPGLKWRDRKGGAVPYWFADSAAIKAGYPVKGANLSHLASNAEMLIARAQRLQAEMLRWVSGDRGTPPRFDGTFKSLLEIYQTDPESTYNTKIKKHTAQSYATYIRKMTDHIGARRVDECDGRDVRRWFKQWRETSGLGAARMALAVLKAAVSFGVVCRTRGCAEFQAILGEMEFEAMPSRTQAPTADQIVAIRKAAHAAGRPLAALCYAVQFETTLRQWDVIGQWFDLDDPRPSAVLAYGKKWIGPTWAAIEQPDHGEGKADQDRGHDRDHRFFRSVGLPDGLRRVGADPPGAARRPTDRQPGHRPTLYPAELAQCVGGRLQSGKAAGGHVESRSPGRRHHRGRQGRRIEG